MYMCMYTHICVCMCMCTSVCHRYKEISLYRWCVNVCVGPTLWVYVCECVYMLNYVRRTYVRIHCTSYIVRV